MLFENEKKLLKIIKYAPTIFVLSITIFILAISFFENKKKFEKDKEKIRFEYIQRNEDGDGAIKLINKKMIRKRVKKYKEKHN